MIVVDSSALVAILHREPEAGQFNTIIGAADRTFLSAMSLLETSMVLTRQRDVSTSWSDLDRMIDSLEIEIVPFDAEQARFARAAFLRYGKGRHKAGLNMGDCASYALARSRNLPLLFKGHDFTRTDLAEAA